MRQVYHEVELAPRIAQKNRTRAALLEAARALMAEGQEITLARVADAAQISRATIYRYFSDPGVLAADAALDVEVVPTAELLKGRQDVRERVHIIARYYLEFSREHESLFRQFLARSMRVWSEQEDTKMRGARRVAAFAEALLPVRSNMKPAEFDDLVMRLSMLTGMEQHIVLEDILQVDAPTGDRLQSGIVDALLDRYLP